MIAAQVVLADGIAAAIVAVFVLTLFGAYFISSRRRGVNANGDPHASVEREEQLARREATIDGVLQSLHQRETRLEIRQRELESREVELQRLEALQLEELERLAGLRSDEAKALLLQRHDESVRQSARRIAAAVEDDARERAEHRARDIVATAVQRLAESVTLSITTTAVAIPDAEMKSRIIGKEGRNIRAFEERSGVNLLIDEQPDAVVLSSFDPKRREIARAALEGLIADGRIYPSTIEEQLEQAAARAEQIATQAASEAAIAVGVHNLAPALLALLGELHFRSSYGYNVLQHSVETAHLAGMMALELGVDATLVRRAALLHDVGKTRTHEDEGSHARLGAELLARWDESAAVCHAVEAHHGEVEPLTVEAVLLQAADAVSLSRPGGKRAQLEQYLTRLRRIEGICEGFAGVERAHAMQAGRDIRVMVCPDSVNDEQVRDLARRIAERVEGEVARPGRLTVTVVRELRATETVR